MLQRRALAPSSRVGIVTATPSLIGAEQSSGTTINVPAGAQAGDFAMLLADRTDPVSGWTQSYDGDLEVLYRFLPDPPPSSYTFPTMNVGILAVFRNVDASTPFDYDSVTGDPEPLTSTNTSPAVTTSYSGSLVVPVFKTFAVGTGDGGDVAYPAGYSPIAAHLRTGNTFFGTLYYRVAAAYKARPNTGTETIGPWRAADTLTPYAGSGLTAGTIVLKGAAFS